MHTYANTPQIKKGTKPQTHRERAPPRTLTLTRHAQSLGPTLPLTHSTHGEERSVTQCGVCDTERVHAAVRSVCGQLYSSNKDQGFPCFLHSLAVAPQMHSVVYGNCSRHVWFHTCAPGIDGVEAGTGLAVKVSAKRGKLSEGILGCTPSWFV